MQSWNTCPGDIGNASCPYYAWNNSEFASILDTPQYEQLLYTFVEQRQWSVDIPLSALPASHPIVQQALPLFTKLRPTGPPNLDSHVRTDNRSFVIGNVTVHVSDSGGLDGVSVNGVPVANVHTPFAGVAYQLFDEDSYTRFLEAYANCDVRDSGPNGCSWAFYDYGKAGLDTHSHLGERTITPTHTDTYVAQLSDTLLSVITNAYFAAAAVDYHVVAGAPARVWSEYLIDSSALGGINISITLLNKTATRIPEALWLVFNSTSEGRLQREQAGPAATHQRHQRDLQRQLAPAWHRVRCEQRPDGCHGAQCTRAVSGQCSDAVPHTVGRLRHQLRRQRTEL